MHFSGTPNANTQAVEYEISIVNKDPHADVNDFTWNANFTITPNDPPTLDASSIIDQTLKAPDGLEWEFGASIVSDPESLTVQRSILMNGSPVESWLTSDLNDFKFSIISSSNSIAGVYTVSLTINDGFNPDVTESFTITIQENFAPVKVMSIENYEVVNYNLLNITFEDVDTLFQDPDGRPMNGSVRLFNGANIPSFLAYNPVENRMHGIPEIIHVGEWNFQYVATDDHNHEGIISFKVVVNRKLLLSDFI